MSGENRKRIPVNIIAGPLGVGKAFRMSNHRHTAKRGGEVVAVGDADGHSAVERRLLPSQATIPRRLSLLNPL